MKKVLVIGLKGLPARGGAAAVGETILMSLKHKYQFTVLSVSSHTHLSTGNTGGIHQIVYNAAGTGGFNTLWYYCRCLVHALTHRYDLVFLHHAESGFITPFLKLRHKVVVTFHGVFSYADPKFSGFHNRFFRFSERMNVKYADAVVSVSQEGADFIRTKYGRQVLYIPNGISLGNMRLVNPEFSGPFIFFAAGRIYNIKGLHLLLKALRDAKINLPLLVAGKREELQEYNHEIDALSDGINVKYLGMITEKERLLGYAAAAEIFIFPSLYEAMSMMLLEAVATGVPVIASDIPANRNIFDENELLFFRSGDAGDLSEKITFALRNSTVMRRMANKAHQRLSETYTSQSVSNKYESLFESLA